MLTDREGLLGKTIRSHAPDLMDISPILSLRWNSLLGNPAVKQSFANKLIVPFWQSPMDDASGDKAYNLYTTIVQAHEHGMARVCHQYNCTCLALTILTVYYSKYFWIYIHSSWLYTILVCIVSWITSLYYPFGTVQDRSVVTIARAEVSKVEDMQEKQVLNGEARPQYSVILPLAGGPNISRIFLLVQNCKLLSLPWTETAVGERHTKCSTSIIGFWLTLVVFQTDSIAVSVFFFHFHQADYRVSLVCLHRFAFSNAKASHTLRIVWLAGPDGIPVRWSLWNEVARQYGHKQLHLGMV